MELADLCWYDSTRGLAGTSETLDLSGVLSDVFGNTLTFAEIKLIWIENLSTTSGEVLKVGAGSNPLANWRRRANLPAV